MTAATHHLGVMLRLLATTRGGLIAMLVLLNSVPMVAMSMFVAGGEHRFAYGYTLETFAFSLLFVPLSRWALGYALGRHAGRSTAAVLPLSPRGRAGAEVVAIVVALWVPAAVVTGLAAVVAGTTGGPELGELLASWASLCAAVSALALPHLILASLDQDATYRHRIWIRWLAAPSLIGLGLALPAARTLGGYVLVGLGAAAIVAAWGPVSWLGSTGRRARVAPPLDPRRVGRHAPGEPATMLRRDLWSGLAFGATRGGLWAAALVGPLVLLGWWKLPALAAGAFVVVAAVVAGGYPLGVRTRVWGGRWSNNGDFARAWSVLPIPRRTLVGTAYLHIAACSAVVLVGVTVGLAMVRTGSPAASAAVTTAALSVSVAALALVGIRTNTAVGTRLSWQLSWLGGSCAAACVWLSRFALDAPQHSTLSTALGGIAVVTAVAVALSPVALLRARRARVSSEPGLGA